MAHIWNSEFDGRVGELFVNFIIAYLITVLTLGICAPWALCVMFRWNAGHTVIEGHRLKFVGTGGELFGQWIAWYLLTLITFGIYSPWLFIKLEQWKVKNTLFTD